MRSHFIAEDCAFAIRTLAELMITEELPAWRSVEFTPDRGLTVSVSPADFTVWRNALEVDTPRRIVTVNSESLLARGQIEGVGLELMAYGARTRGTRVFS